MPNLRLKLAAGLLLVVILMAFAFAWRADRRDRAELASQLAAANATIQAAAVSQRTRDAQLVLTLQQLDAEKRAAQSPQQLVAALARLIALPAPLQLAAAHAAAISESAAAATPAANVARSSTTIPAPPNSSQPSASPPGDAILPSSDLKPLYNFAIDCKACQARLAASQSDLADERAKTLALTKERDLALAAAKGGSAWRRVGRAAKWIALGAAAGGAAVALRRH